MMNPELLYEGQNLDSYEGNQNGAYPHSNGSEVINNEIDVVNTTQNVAAESDSENLESLKSPKEEQSEEALLALDAETIELLKCSICKEIIPLVEVRKHTADHFASTLEHICDTCGKSFKEGFALKNHMRFHTGEKPFQCAYCDRSFSIVESLRHHERIKHTKVGLQHCDTCGQQFASVRGLKSHMNLKHGIEDRYQCKWCGKYFQTTKGKEAHEDMGGCRNNKCEICGAYFDQARELKRHTNRYHGTKKQFACKYCEYSCTRETNLNAHIRKAHTNGEPYKKPTNPHQQYPCHICSKNFSTPTAFLAHLETHNASAMNLGISNFSN